MGQWPFGTTFRVSSTPGPFDSQVHVQSTAEFVAAAPTLVLTSIEVSPRISSDNSREVKRSRPNCFQRSAAAGKSYSPQPTLRSLSVGARHRLSAQSEIAVLPSLWSLPVVGHISIRSEIGFGVFLSSDSLNLGSCDPFTETHCALATTCPAGTAQVSFVVCNHTVSTP